MNKPLTSIGRRYPRLWLAALLTIGGFGLTPLTTARGATTNVSVLDDFFSPSSVTIHQGDKVKWTWDGNISHSSTGPGTPPLWDSGVLLPGSTFTNTFNTTGTFAYHCVIHSAMLGSVTVQAAVNVPPSVAITSPANGASFAAPWSGALHATASDTDDTISKVNFYDGANLLGTVSNPPASFGFNVTNLAAGTYNLKAIATDSRGATNASAIVTVQVLIPAAISLSSPRRLSSSSFQLLYTATPGLNYVVQRSSALPAFTALNTNTAATNKVTYIDNRATGVFNVYSVKLLPNP